LLIFLSFLFFNLAFHLKSSSLSEELCIRSCDPLLCSVVVHSSDCCFNINNGIHCILGTTKDDCTLQKGAFSQGRTICSTMDTTNSYSTMNNQGKILFNFGLILAFVGAFCFVVYLKSNDDTIVYKATAVYAEESSDGDA